MIWFAYESACSQNDLHTKENIKKVLTLGHTKKSLFMEAAIVSLPGNIFVFGWYLQKTSSCFRFIFPFFAIRRLSLNCRISKYELNVAP